MISSFSQFLVEEDKTVYFTFGRMNPPTIGHEKLLNTLSSKSGRNPYRVYLSQSQDKNKNPLDYRTKIKTARKFFPKHSRSIMMNNKLKTVFNVMTRLHNEGFKNVVMVVGSDRVNEFDILLKKYNGKKGPHGFYDFRSINVVSAGERDPDSDGVRGMSASKMRQAAKDNNFTTFSQGLPRTVSNMEAKKIFNTIRSSMGLKEQKEFKNHIQFESVSELRENYVNGMLYNIGDNVVIKESGEIANIKHLGPNYVILESTGNTKRKWLDDIEKMQYGVEIAKEGLQESLWANIHAKRRRGEKMRKKGEKGAPTPDQIKRAQGEKTEVPQDPDIAKRKGTQPAKYHKGLSKSTKAKRDAQFKRQAKMSDRNPAAYKPAPGDATGKTKPSKHTISFKKMFGEQDAVDLAKKRIDQEKMADKKKHDAMMDRARLRDTKIKNRETS